MSFNNKIFFNEDIKMLQNLSFDEQIKLIKEYQQGSKEARDALIEFNIRYVIFAVKNKFQINDCDIEDLINIGIIGLIKGINTYKLEKGVKPITYFSITQMLDFELVNSKNLLQNQYHQPINLLK